MWITFIATGVATAVCLSVVNLASELNRIQDVRVSPSVEYKSFSNAPRAHLNVKFAHNTMETPL
jgi:hypothetical protein